MCRYSEGNFFLHAEEKVSQTTTSETELEHKLTRLSVYMVSCDDLLLVGVRVLLVPGDLHDDITIIGFVVAGEDGLLFG